MALKVTVHRRWKRDKFYSEQNDGITVGINAGILTVSTSEKISSYNCNRWFKVTSEAAPSQVKG